LIAESQAVPCVYYEIAKMQVIEYLKYEILKTEIAIENFQIDPDDFHCQNYIIIHNDRLRCFKDCKYLIETKIDKLDCLKK
jgi:hypothetical protein